MFLNYFYFALEALIPAAFTAIFFLLEKHTKFKDLNYWIKQVIIGVVFGGIAIFGTHFGVQIEGAVVNARDAAVIPAGLIFGWPAGIISGFVGGLERMIVGLINPVKFGFTVIACSVSTFLAGVVSGFVRKFIFNDKRAGFLSGLFVGFVIETFHLFMVFVTNAAQYQKAFKVVRACTPPMLIANSLGVLVAILVYAILEKGKDAFKKPDRKSLNGRFTFVLASLTLAAFILSSTFVYLFNDSMVKKQTNNDLTYAIAETDNEVRDKITQEAYNLKEILGRNQSEMTLTGLQQFCDREGLAEINIIKNDGEIWHSSDTKYDISTRAEVFNMGEYEQSAAFMDILKENGPETFVQEFRKQADEDEGKGNQFKYVGIRFFFDSNADGENDELGILQFGYDKDGLKTLVENVANFKSVGETGGMIIINDESAVVSSANSLNFEQEDCSSLFEFVSKNNVNTTYKFSLSGREYYINWEFIDAHYIISLITVEEANLSRNISIFVNTFLEIIVFGLVFLTIYNLNLKLTTERIEATNNTLKKITKGDLKARVDGGTTTEFVSLAKGINSTVKALEGYIDAANKRIDEELAFAKAIQTNVLPSTFPAFPDRKEFDIYASMHTAKEVGGDFYDFYFSNTTNFHFTIADVSGKGIPAALFMMRAKSILKSLSQTNMPINDVFTEGNTALCDGNEAGMFVTAWSASIDLTTGVLTYANGGHNPPLVKHANGKFEYLSSRPNMVLAGMDGMKYNINEMKLEKGDIIYLYTDGVTEGINTKTEQYGEQRLLDAMNSREFNSCQEICDFIYKEVTKFADGAAQFDDITMLAFKYNGK